MNYLVCSFIKGREYTKVTGHRVNQYIDAMLARIPDARLETRRDKKGTGTYRRYRVIRHPLGHLLAIIIANTG